MEEDKVLNSLKEQFKYCSAIEFHKCEHPLYHKGYDVVCGVHGFIIEGSGDCSTCQLKKNE